MDSYAVRSLEDLNREVVRCTRCERLSAYIREIAEKKVRRYRDWEYWGRPLPGFGDPNARLLIVGLAPAAHGANRTGRMFTGDSSGNWLARALYETGFANQPESRRRDDGFELRSAYISSVVRCAPPENRPTPAELEMCRPYLVRELELLKRLRVILCLGGIAFRGTVLALRTLYPDVSFRGMRFGHHRRYTPEGLPYVLYTSYHPSRQNTQTGRLSWSAWVSVFRDIRKELEAEL